MLIPDCLNEHFVPSKNWIVRMTLEGIASFHIRIKKPGAYSWPSSTESLVLFRRRLSP